MSAVFRIETGIFDRFPDVHLGVVICEGLHNRGQAAHILSELAQLAAALPERIPGNVSEHPHIATWRSAYQQFGAKPKKYPSSIENLVRRILSGYVPGHINTLVDLYNLVSIKHLLPVGGEDLDRIQGDIVLALAGDNEPAIQLLGEAEARAPKAGEVIYKDEIGAICRRWNWKEAERTKLTEDTTRAVLVLEALPPVSVAQLENATLELEMLAQDICQARTRRSILSRDHPQVSITTIEKRTPKPPGTQVSGP